MSIDSSCGKRGEDPGDWAGGAVLRPASPGSNGATLYRPAFDDERVIAVARRRGIVSADETIRSGLDRVVRALSRADESLEAEGSEAFRVKLREAMHAGRVAPSSQLFAAADRPGQAVAACTVLPTKGSSDTARLERLAAEARIASQLGMGCGIDVTEFDDPVAALQAINEDIVRVHRDLVSRSMRPPALMVTCAARHPRAAAFIDAKRNADFSLWAANISLRIGSNQEFETLRTKLAVAAHRNGEPGVLFQDVADEDNPTPGIELRSTAPCAEVFLAAGERCVFVTVNVAAHVEGKAFNYALFKESVRLAVRAGDSAVELAVIGADPIVARRRRIGVGLCGFHSALIELGIPYSRSEAFASQLSEILTFAAHSASADLAFRRGPFPLFRVSRWTEPTWVRRKEARRSGWVSNSEWRELERRITAKGIRNAAVVAYPPTGVVATLLGVSKSYEPHWTLAGRSGVASRGPVQVVPEVERRLAEMPNRIAVRGKILDPASGLQLPGAGPNHLLACARQLAPSTHVAIHAAFSGLADEAGSKTVNLPSTATVADVAELYDDARSLGLKGITVFRDGSLDEEVAA